MAEHAAKNSAPEAEGHEEHWHPPYWMIFFILLGLTVVEMGLAFFPVFWIAVSCMIVIAVVKIAYIARYFMHLRFDDVILKAIAASPLVFASFLAFGLLLEYA